MKLSLFSKPAGDGDFFESIKFFLGKIVVVAHDRYAVIGLILALIIHSARFRIDARI